MISTTTFEQIIVIDVQTSASNGGVDILVEVNGSLASGVSLGIEALEERQTLAERVQRSQVDDDTSFWWSGDVIRDRRIATAQVANAALRAWDWQHWASPLLRAVDTRPTLLLAPGATDLPLFSVRSALRHGVRGGELSGARYTQIVPLSLWSGVGCEHLAELATAGALPAFSPSSTAVVIGPEPDGWRRSLDALLIDLPTNQFDYEISDAVTRQDLEMIEAIATRVRWTQAIHNSLKGAADRLRMKCLTNATSEDFINLLKSPQTISTLGMIIHQDHIGLHFYDRVVTLDELRETLELREQASPFASVDLAVCRAEESHNLADCFQSSGTPIILTYGPRAHFGRAQIGWLYMLRAFAEHGPLGLPELVDHAWYAAFQGRGIE